MMGSPFTEQELATARAIIVRHDAGARQGGASLVTKTSMREAVLDCVLSEAADCLAQINADIDALILGRDASAVLRDDFIARFATLSQTERYDATARLRSGLPHFGVTEFKRRVEEARKEAIRQESAADPDGCPAGSKGPFRVTGKGVVYTDPDPEKEPMEICGPLEVVALPATPDPLTAFTLT